MPRGLRLDAPGVLYHLSVRGIERCAFFREERDRADFVAWALLPNHAHLLVRTGRRPLAAALRSLLTGYAGAFSRRHKRHGHPVQNRDESIVVEQNPYLLELTRYIHLNPLRGGLVLDLAALARYAWGGHRTLLGRRPQPWQAGVAEKY